MKGPVQFHWPDNALDRSAVLDAGISLIDPHHSTGQVLAGFVRIRAPVLRGKWEVLPWYEDNSNFKVQNHQFEIRGPWIPDGAEEPQSVASVLVLDPDDVQTTRLDPSALYFDGLVAREAGRAFRRVGDVRGWIRTDEEVQEVLDANMEDVTLV